MNNRYACVNLFHFDDGVADGKPVEREWSNNGILCNLLVQLCQKLNCTMIWLNFNGWNGEFAFDLHDRDILFFKNLFHPSLATSANSLCYGNPNNQKRYCQVKLKDWLII